ncbi:MAG: exo-alpha-sialidase [Parabacteroides sp.]|nr:exo-alpha-sialidase [Parabacteroides sp.]
MTLTVDHPVIPVLVKKAANPAIRLNLTANGSAPYTLSGIKLALDGTTDLHDIVSLAVYEAGADGRIDTTRLVCPAAAPRRRLVFTDRLRVTRDTLRLWVSVTLQAKVALHHRIGIRCTRVKAGNRWIPAGKQDARPQRIGVAVRQRGQDGVSSSRIPGLVTTSRGTLIAVFDARYRSARDLQGDIDIALHRSTDKGESWQPLQVALDMGQWGGLPEKYNGVSDACVLVDETTGALFIAGLWMHGALDERGKWKEGLTRDSTYWIHQWHGKGSQLGVNPRETCQFLITRSTDDGLTWSFPLAITPYTKRPEWWLFGPAPGHGITLRDGTLVFPAQGRDANGLPFATIAWSADHGKSWTAGNPAFGNVTESNAVELADGTVMLNMRDNRNRGVRSPNGRRICTTPDRGVTWREHPSSRKALVEPTCMASLHRHTYTANGTEKSVLLFANPNDYRTRDKLTLKASVDDGATWPEKYWLLFDEYRSAGYSSIMSVDEHTIGILYESNLADLVFIQVKLEELFSQHEPF